VTPRCPISRDAERCNVDNTNEKVARLFPACPRYLKVAAAQLWPAVVRKLVAENDWDPHDSELVTAVYCTYAAALSAAVENVSERGAIIEASMTRVEMHNPYCKTLREAAEAVLKYGELLNLTPQSRAYRLDRQQQAARKRVFDETGRWPP
jgi:P27 family predicted phage terminase small subunit